MKELDDYAAQVCRATMEDYHAGRMYRFPATPEWGSCQMDVREWRPSQMYAGKNGQMARFVDSYERNVAPLSADQLRLALNHPARLLRDLSAA